MVAATKRPRRQIGPIERAARRVDAVEEKRRVLLALAAFADEGVDNPSILELSRRCRVHRMAVVLKLDKLARDGVIAFQPGDYRRYERTVYRFLIPIPPNPKENSMTTDTQAAEAAKATEAEAAQATTDSTEARTGPHWQREGLWPPPPEGFKWPALTDAIERHNDAVEVLAGARVAEDAEAEQEAVLALCDVVLDGLGDLRRTLSKAEADFEAARKAVVRDYGEDGLIPEGERDAHRAAVRDAQGWVDHDLKSIRKVLRMLDPDTFYPPDNPGSSAVPALEAKVRMAKDAVR